MTTPAPQAAATTPAASDRCGASATPSKAPAQATSGRRSARPAPGARGVAQRLRDAGELLGLLALDPHRDQERAGLGRADLAGEQRGHRLARLVEGQRAAAARAGPDRLDDGAEAP